VTRLLIPVKTKKADNLFMRLTSEKQKHVGAKTALMFFLALAATTLACRIPFSLVPTEEPTEPSVPLSAETAPPFHSESTPLETVTLAAGEVTPRAQGDLISLMSQKNAPQGKVAGLWLAADQTLWVSASDGIFIFQQNQWKKLIDRGGGHIWGMDKGGRVWVLLEDGSSIASFESLRPLIYAADKGWLPLSSTASYLNGVGDGLVTDKEGRVWLATGEDSLRRFDPQTDRWESFFSEQIGLKPAVDLKMESNMITDVALSADGSVWVSSCTTSGEVLTGQTVQAFDGENWRSILKTKGHCVLDMESTENGDMWVGGFDVLLHYDPNQDLWLKLPLPTYERRQIVYAVDIDSAQRPWVEVALGGGASMWGATVRYHLEGTQWVEDFNPKSWILSSVAFGPRGKTWLCAEGNISLYQSGKMQQVEKLDTYNCQIAAGPQGDVYVAALEGPDAGVWALLK
jgi:streptogramin lyase